MRLVDATDVERELIIGALEIAITECKDQKGESAERLTHGFRVVYKKLTGKEFSYT